MVEAVVIVEEEEEEEEEEEDNCALPLPTHHSILMGFDVTTSSFSLGTKRETLRCECVFMFACVCACVCVLLCEQELMLAKATSLTGLLHS